MTAVFVHGNPETTEIWSPLVTALAERGIDDVVLVSPPGFGAPVPDGFDPTPASYVAWLASELEAVGAPVDLVGHDWGAGHTYGLAAERPELLRSWAADCAGMVHPDYEWHDMARVWQTPGDGEAAVEMMTAMSLADATATYRAMGMPDPIAGSMAHALGPEMARCILGLYRAASQPFMAELGRRLAGAEQRPGLVIDATDDPYVPSALASPTAESVGATIATMPGQGHWWMVQDPQNAAESLIAFWKTLH